MANAAGMALTNMASPPEVLRIGHEFPRPHHPRLRRRRSAQLMAMPLDQIGGCPTKREEQRIGVARGPLQRLGLKLEALAHANPQYVGVVLGGHGLFTWADDAKTC